MWSAGSVKTIPPRVQGETTVNGKRNPGPVGAGSPVKGFLKSTNRNQDL